MNERNDWSVGVGRWFGVPVRLHLLLFLFVLLIGSLEWQHSDRNPSISGSSLVYAVCLVLVVLAHELAHVLAATSLGGAVSGVTLTPWGGFSDLQVSGHFRSRLTIQGAGIFANLCLFLISGFMILQTGRAELSDFTHPFRPPVFMSVETTLSVAQIFAWLNFQVALVNLIPCFPFDFAQMMRTLFGAVNEEVCDLKIESTVKAIGQLSGAVMIGIGVLSRHQTGGPIEPMWALMVGMGIVVFFAARCDFRQRLRAMYEQSDNWGEEIESEMEQSRILEDDDQLAFLTDESGYSQWLKEKRQERERTRVEIEGEIERDEALLADEILTKLHERGIEALSQEERHLLERVSARIRQRRQPRNVE